MNKNKNKMTKKKKVILTLCIGLGAGLIIGACFLGWFFYQFLFGSAPTVSDNPADYHLLSENRIHSGLMLFPKEISDTASDVKFHYYWRDLWNIPGVEIFLSCRYEPEEYKQEVNRISSTQKSIGTHTKKVYYDNCKLFDYPAYVAVNDNSILEYALLLPDNRTIVYIFTESGGDIELSFDKSYLPHDFDKLHRNETGKGFSIYEVPVEDMEELDATTGYYDRAPEVSREMSHYVVSGKYSFYVYTEQDLNGTETITECNLWYFDQDEGWFDVSVPEEKNWDFEDLNGEIYHDLTISKDRKSAVITYKNETGEHTAVFDIEKKGFVNP